MNMVFEKYLWGYQMNKELINAIKEANLSNPDIHRHQEWLEENYYSKWKSKGLVIDYVIICSSEDINPFAIKQMLIDDGFNVSVYEKTNEVIPDVFLVSLPD